MVAQQSALLPHSAGDPGSIPPSGIYVEFARSPRVCMGFLWVLWFPPTVQRCDGYGGLAMLNCPVVSRVGKAGIGLSPISTGSELLECHCVPRPSIYCLSPVAPGEGGGMCRFREGNYHPYSVWSTCDSRPTAIWLTLNCPLGDWIGDKLPAVNVHEGDPHNIVNTANLFKGKKGVLFGVPGAFTPACAKSHLPSYVENYEELKKKGIEIIACISVNDAFVMSAWGKDQKTDGKYGQVIPYKV
eukprot:g39260.t1